MYSISDWKIYVKALVNMNQSQKIKYKIYTAEKYMNIS